MAETLVDCVVCRRLVEQILLLECNHNPCIGCAAQLTRYGQLQHYECPECHNSTKLEPATVQELRKLASTNKPTHFKSVSSLDGTLKKVVRLSNHHATTKSTLAPIDDEAFCFECWKVLSLEDMMLDAHRNHDVKMLSKSFTKLKHMLNDQDQHLRRKDNEILQLTAISERSKRQCEELIDSKKKEIVETFGRLTRVLEQTRDEAVESVKSYYKRYLKALDTQVGEYRKRSAEAASLKTIGEDIECKLTECNKLAFQEFERLGSRLKLLEQYSEYALPEMPNMCPFEIDPVAVDKMVRSVNKFDLFVKKELEPVPFKASSTSTKHLRIKTEPHDDPDSSFFTRLKSKVFSGSNIDEFSSRLRQGRKTPSSDRNRHQLSTLSDIKPNSQQPLEITKLQLKKQLAVSTTSATKTQHLTSSALRNNKQNLYRIIL